MHVCSCQSFSIPVVIDVTRMDIVEMKDADGNIYTFEQILLLECSFSKFDQEVTIWLSTLEATH